EILKNVQRFSIPQKIKIVEKIERLTVHRYFGYLFLIISIFVIYGIVFLLVLIFLHFLIIYSK
ncbi:MAG: hypothetical protein QXT21_00800, partial [Thermoplasmata archaeon]